MVHWDEDARKDLLIGQSDGKLNLFLNIGTDASPTFDGGTFLQVGPAGSKVDMDVTSRATPTMPDWNNDGNKDLIVGDLYGNIHVFLNEGTHDAPDFVSETYIQEDGANLAVPGIRASPVIYDLDWDGKKDLLTGNTTGELLFYSNVGTDAAPTFSGYVLLDADGVAIDLPGSYRSRPSVCDWTGDGLIDVLIGYGDGGSGGNGKVRLYQGVPLPGDFNGDGLVDDYDLDRFATCFTGEDGGPLPPACVLGDFDGDDDVDCADWDAFVLVWTEPEGPTMPPEVVCGGPIPTVSEYGLILMGLVVLGFGAAVLRRRGTAG